MRIIIFIGFLFLLSGVYISCDKADDSGTNPSGWIVNFPDSNLSLVIREALDKPFGDITRFDLLTIDSLIGISRGIKYLDGLGYLDNLKYLNLSNNEIFDIEDLASLDNLESLVLSFNKLIKVDSLASLNALKSLRLNNNGITVVSFLAFLQNLSEAVISGNYIHTIGPIVNNSYFGSGDSFDLRGNPLDDISRYQYIPALRARGVQITF